MSTTHTDITIRPNYIGMRIGFWIVCDARTGRETTCQTRIHAEEVAAAWAAKGNKS